MTVFRGFLACFLLVLLVYTTTVISNHGLDLLPIFFGDMALMAWPGQFNFDFLGFLLLSGIWTVWRNGFSGIGFALGVLAVCGGMMFLSIYLLVLSFQTKGDIREIILGVHQGSKP